MSVFVIGEAGVNHNGSLENAIKLIDVAKKAGCNAVKFQTFDCERVASESASLAKYQVSNLSSEINQREMLRPLQLTYVEFECLKKYCDDIKIEFMSTPSDPVDLDFLISIGIKRIKIASADIDNKPLLYKASQTGLQIILSTGMATFFEVQRSINYIKSFTTSGEIVIMQCTSEYPCPDEYLNLNVVDTYRKTFDLPTGFSDHSEGKLASLCAVAKGVNYIEKHFTLSNELSGPDHKASLEPQELEKFIQMIRKAEIFMGKEDKEVTRCEKDNRLRMRKSLTIDQFGNHLMQRPANKGIDPWDWEPS